MKKRDGMPWLTGGLILALAAASLDARAESADLDWLGIVYLWGANITADSQDRSAGVDFNDIVDKLEMSFMTHVEAQGEDFGGFVDVVFVGVGDNSSNSLADFNSDLDMTAMDLALVWSPGAERMTGIEAFAGLRYIDTDFHLVVDPVPPGLPNLETGLNTSYTDFLAGVRYGAPLNDRWRLIFSGDLSGGDTEGTWSVAAIAAYRTGVHHFYAGYRHFVAEMRTGGGEKLTETMSGPVIAYGYSF